MGDMGHKLAFVLLHLPEAHPQPIEATTKKFQIPRTADANRFLVIPLAEPIDTLSDLPNRLSDQSREQGHNQGCHQDQSQRQPGQNLASLVSRLLHGVGFLYDQLLAFFINQLSPTGEQGKSFDQRLAGSRIIGRAAEPELIQSLFFGFKH